MDGRKLTKVDGQIRYSSWAPTMVARTGGPEWSGPWSGYFWSGFFRSGPWSSENPDHGPDQENPYRKIRTTDRTENIRIEKSGPKNPDHVIYLDRSGFSVRSGQPWAQTTTSNRLFPYPPLSPDRRLFWSSTLVSYDRPLKTWLEIHLEHFRV